MITQETLKARRAEQDKLFLDVLRDCVPENVSADSSHLGDVFATLAIAYPGFVELIAGLVEADERAVAVAAVSARLDEMANRDRWLLAEAPSREKYAYLAAQYATRTTLNRLPVHQRAYFIGEGERINGTDRRRRAYEMRHEIDRRRAEAKDERHDSEAPDQDDEAASQIVELIGSTS